MLYDVRILFFKVYGVKKMNAQAVEKADMHEEKTLRLEEMCKHYNSMKAKLSASASAIDKELKI